MADNDGAVRGIALDLIFEDIEELHCDLDLEFDTDFEEAMAEVIIIVQFISFSQSSTRCTNLEGRSDIYRGKGKWGRGVIIKYHNKEVSW